MPERIVILDIYSVNSTIAFDIKQYEDLKLHVILNDRKKPYMLDNELVELYIKYKNNNNDAISYESKKVIGNDIYIDIPSDFFSLVGILECELNVKGDLGVLKTPIFYGSVSRSLSGSGVTYDLVDSEGYKLIDADGYELKVRG